MVQLIGRSKLFKLSRWHNEPNPKKHEGRNYGVEQLDTFLVPKLTFTTIKLRQKLVVSPDVAACGVIRDVPSSGTRIPLRFMRASFLNLQRF